MQADLLSWISYIQAVSHNERSGVKAKTKMKKRKGSPIGTLLREKWQQIKLYDQRKYHSFSPINVLSRHFTWNAEIDAG